MLLGRLRELIRAKLFYKIDDKVIASETGKKVPSSSANPIRDAIVIIKGADPHRAYTQSEKKHVSGYNYKAYNTTKKSVEWWYAATLDTNFLRDVLYHKYQTTAILITDKYIDIALFGKNVQETIYDKRNEADRMAHINKIFQGVEYKEVDINAAIDLVRENTELKKTLTLAVTGAVVLMFLYGVLPKILGDGGDEIEVTITPRENPRNLFTKTAQILQENFIQDETLNKIIETTKFIEAFKKAPIEPLSFVGTLDLSLKSYERFSLVPKKNSIKRDDFFVTAVTPPIPNRYKERDFTMKDPMTCLGYLADAEVLSVDETSTSIRLATSYSQEQVYTLVRQLSGCPIVFGRGSISFKSARSMNVDLDAKIYENYN